MRRPTFLTLAALAALLSAACTAPQTDPQQPPLQPSAVESEEAIEAGDVPVEGTEAEAAMDMEERVLPGGLVEIGKADAPVAVVLFTNHSCPYCRQFHREHFPRLLSEEVRSGNVRITVIPFLLRKYADSDINARTLLCAARQGKGRIIHDLLFTGGQAALQPTDGTSLVYDRGALETCLRDNAITTEITAQQSWARALGITLIPTALVDGKRLTGLSTYGELQGLIDLALRDARAQ